VPLITVLGMTWNVVAPLFRDSQSASSDNLMRGGVSLKVMRGAGTAILSNLRQGLVRLDHKSHSKRQDPDRSFLCKWHANHAANSSKAHIRQVRLHNLSRCRCQRQEGDGVDEAFSTTSCLGAFLACAYSYVYSNQALGMYARHRPCCICIQKHVN